MKWCHKTGLMIVLLTAGVWGQTEIRRLTTLWQEEKWDALRVELPAVANRYPDHPTVHFFIALLDRDGDSAYRRFRSGLNRFPADLADDALLKVAQYHQVRGEYNQAAPYFEMLYRRYPSSLLADDARYQFCLCQLAQGKKDSARMCLQQLIRDEKRSIFVDWAILDLESMATPSAAAKPTSVIGSKPEMGEFYIQLGAYRVVANAKQYVKKLHDAGFDAEVVEKKTSAGNVFAVWVGPLTSKEGAIEFAKKNVAPFAPEYVILKKGN